MTLSFREFQLFKRFTTIKYNIESKSKNSFLKSGLLLPIFLMVFSIGAKAQYDVTVAKDGTGDFTTLQAAINAAPSGLITAYKIFVKKGKYKEKVNIPSTKPFIYVIGESINETIISWDDYAGRAGVTEIATLTIYAADCALMNMTVENAWGRVNDGPQSLALRANGDRLIFKNCRFISGQDTVMANGNGYRQYYSNCYIDGNTDYIYGSAIAAFDSCVIFSRDRTDGSTGGYLTAANTPPGQTFGYVFRNCLLPNNNGTTTFTLGRPWGNDVQPNTSETKVVFLNCKMGTTIVPTRWSVWSATTNTAAITYAEYNSTNFNGNPINLSARLSWTQQFNSTQASPYFINSNLFGTWDPCSVLATACVPLNTILSLSNVRVNRNSSSSTVKFNLCWPVNGASIQLLRSTDSLNFATTSAVVGTLTTIVDTIVSYQFTDALPGTGISYFYRVKATKIGLQDCTSDTMLKVNISIPLNGDFRSAGSGGWSNNTSAIATLSSGAVSAVTITSSPSGYTGTPTVTFTASPGITATGTAIVSGGVVTGVTIVNAGSGYVSVPTLTFSTASGGTSIWEKYTSSTSTWGPVAFGTAPSNANVTIVSGHTVKLNALAGVTNLIIQNGATLNSTGTAAGTGVNAPQTLRAGSGTAPVSTIIQNDGMFGSTDGLADGIILEAFTSCSSLVITGTGTTFLARFRPTAGNVNTTTVLNIVVDQNISLGYNSVCFTGYYGSSTNNIGEKCTITINAGKTVKLTHPSGGIHAGSGLSTNPQGNVTYNINGILDLSSTTTNQNFVPSTHTASTAAITTMNISGSIILGTGNFNTVSSTQTNPATARIYIKTGSVLDARLANSLITTTAAYGSFFIVEGTGALKLNVASAAKTFAIGTGVSSYSPVTLTNTGAADNFTVGVSNVFTNSFPNSTQAVNKQWSIIADNIAPSNISASFGWVTADQANAFSPTSSLTVSNYNNSAWSNTSSSTATGTGVATDPYMTVASGFTNFGNFVVSNMAVVPLTILSFNAGFENKLVKTYWVTTDEINLTAFKVEKSFDGRNFVDLATVAAKNVAGINTYSFVDSSNVSGINYYRLKSIDKNGSFKYSKIVIINIRLKDKISIYPNPATLFITLTHTKAITNGKAEIFTNDGKKILSKIIQQADTQTAIDISTLARGNYFLKYNDNGIISTVKFNKQ